MTVDIVALADLVAFVHEFVGKCMKFVQLRCRRVAHEVLDCAWRNDIWGDIVKIDHRLGACSIMTQRKSSKTMMISLQQQQQQMMIQ